MRHLSLVGVALALGLNGCAIFSPKPPDYNSIAVIQGRLDKASEVGAVMPDYVPMTRRVLWYLPNRFFDVLDCGKLSIGIGPGMGLEIYVTKIIWVSYLNYRSWRLGFDGRTMGVYEDGQYRRWRISEWHLAEWYGTDAAAGKIPIWALSNFRPHEAPLMDGKPAVAEIEKNAWDVGATVHFLIGADILARPGEVFDLLFGLWGDDPSEDDYLIRYYPLHDYEPQQSIVNIFVSAIDQMSEADLKNTLGMELVRTSSMRAGNTLKPLAGGAAPGGQDSGKGYVVVNGIRINPDEYRDDKGNLDFTIRCTGAYLQWNTPAQFEYTVKFYNRYRREYTKYFLQIELENSHWVITKIQTSNTFDD